MARTLVKILDTEMADSKKGEICHVTMKSPGDNTPFVCTLWSQQVKDNFNLVYEKNIGKFMMCDIQFELSEYNGNKEFRTSFAMNGMAVPYEAFLRQEIAKLDGVDKPSPQQLKPASKAS